MPSRDGRNVLPAGDATGRPDASGAPMGAAAVDAPAKTRARGTRTQERARRKQRQAAVEAGEAGEAPELGALNRQLNLVMTQLTTAQRLIGRVAAERDALRKQLADLQGVPVEDIVIPSVGTPTEDAPVTDAVGPQRDVAPSEASRARGRIDRIRRRLPSRRRSQNAPTS